MLPTPTNPSVGLISNPNLCSRCSSAAPLLRTTLEDREPYSHLYARLNTNNPYPQEAFERAAKITALARITAPSSLNTFRPADRVHRADAIHLPYRPGHSFTSH
jgi:hypothetical protein